MGEPGLNSPAKAGRLLLRVISGDEVALAPSDLPAILRHPRFLVFLLASVLMLVALDVRGEARGFPGWLDALFYLGLLWVASTLTAGVLLVLALVQLRRGRAPAVHMTPIVALMAVFLVAASEVTVHLAGGRPLGGPVHLVMLGVLFHALGEVMVVTLANFIVPPILHDLREPPDRPAPADPDHVDIGGLRLAVADLRHIRAEGNYVDIITETARHYRLARFSGVVAALPAGAGRRIHRSHWVANRVLDGFRRDGRDILVRLNDGTEVKVAQSRQRDLLPWLEATTHRIR